MDVVLVRVSLYSCLMKRCTEHHSICLLFSYCLIFHTKPKLFIHGRLFLINKNDKDAANTPKLGLEMLSPVPLKLLGGEVDR